MPLSRPRLDCLGRDLRRNGAERYSREWRAATTRCRCVAIARGYYYPVACGSTWRICTSDSGGQVVGYDAQTERWRRGRGVTDALVSLGHRSTEHGRRAHCPGVRAAASRHQHQAGPADQHVPYEFHANHQPRITEDAPAYMRFRPPDIDVLSRKPGDPRRAVPARQIEVEATVLPLLRVAFLCDLKVVTSAGEVRRLASSCRGFASVQFTVIDIVFELDNPSVCPARRQPARSRPPRPGIYPDENAHVVCAIRAATSNAIRASAR